MIKKFIKVNNDFLIYPEKHFFFWFQIPKFFLQLSGDGVKFISFHLQKVKNADEKSFFKYLNLIFFQTKPQNIFLRLHKRAVFKESIQKKIRDTLFYFQPQVHPLEMSRII